jgi:hypothetical protein
MNHFLDIYYYQGIITVTVGFRENFSENAVVFTDSDISLPTRFPSTSHYVFFLSKIFSKYHGDEVWEIFSIKY